ncbi:MAG TPA: tyrosinase family protein [Bryobacteraceae bacterium]|nr:tyrosinase family protein [Bryobacteraceae bacterium]
MAAVRKDQRKLTTGERSGFIAAVLALKKQGLYDPFVQTHADAHKRMVPHGGPAFLPWHRQFVLVFEQALQRIDPSVTVPYWDWSVDQSPNAAPWTADFMGGSGGPKKVVLDGPFAFANGWQLNVIDPNVGQRELTRRLGCENELPTADDMRAVLDEVPYYVKPWQAFDPSPPGLATQPSFCNRLEGNYGSGYIHGFVHNWVGGEMMRLLTSPNDPIFWLVHSNIDRVWVQWQQMHRAEQYHPTGVGGENSPMNQNLNDPLWPWTVTPADLWSHDALGYRYDSES